MKYKAIFSLNNKLVKGSGNPFYVFGFREEINLDADSKEEALSKAISIIDKRNNIMFKSEISNIENWEILPK